MRVGPDSLLAFGVCALCLNPVTQPKATPSGHLYCNECILSYLVAKKKDLADQKLAYERQQKEAAERESERHNNELLNQVDRFVRREQGVGGGFVVSTDSADHKRIRLSNNEDSETIARF